MVTYGEHAHSLMFELSPPLLHEGHYEGAQVVLVIIRYREGHKELRVVHKRFQIVPRISFCFKPSIFHRYTCILRRSLPQSTLHQTG